ncbi:fibrinogen-like protein 1 [Drosophila busckii]|uniref:fibrinogen-like protein 1 n=1 Tax=Drosophila busckii TaxID=30019 RepID=UPI0014331114|nr:fibrinogen-like protein 1 [Drosophila busckii]
MKCKHYTPLIVFIWALNGVLEASGFSNIVVSSNTSPKRMKSPLHRRYLYNTERRNYHVDDDDDDDDDDVIHRLKEKPRMEDKKKNLQPTTSNMELTNNSLMNEIRKLKHQISTDGKTRENLTTCERERKKQFKLLRKLETCSDELRIKTNKKQQLQDRLENMPSEIMKVISSINDLAELTVKASSCMAYMGHPGKYRIHLPGHMPYNVLCFDGKHEGKGWLMIQRRAFGNEDFDRDWDTYRDGFGSFDGDFFLGLHKIHHITKEQRQQLFIYMGTFDGKWFAASYDNFRVGSEDSEFKLESLGAFRAFNNSRDELRYNERMKFTTRDRDNDLWPQGNCATHKRNGGWWYMDIKCSWCNLNGVYFKVKANSELGVTWTGWDGLKSVHMLIRPFI